MKMCMRLTFLNGRYDKKDYYVYHSSDYDYFIHHNCGYCEVENIIELIQSTCGADINSNKVTAIFEVDNTICRRELFRHDNETYSAFLHRYSNWIDKFMNTYAKTEIYLNPDSREKLIKKFALWSLM